MTEQIEIPTTCPSCSSDLEQVNTQLFCRNTECPAQSTKKVEAFVKKLRIKGLGPASISKLGFVHPIEIYETDLDDYVEILGGKIGQKIFDEVQNSRVTTFAVFLSALSIPLIGNTASKKVAAVANSLGEIFDVDLPIGEKATYNLIDFLAEHETLVSSLEIYFTFKPMVKIAIVENPRKVCITGKLNDFSNRNLAKEYLEGQGYTVTSTISSKTDYLVCEDDSNSSKSKKAESLGIPIVSIIDLIGNKHELG